MRLHGQHVPGSPFTVTCSAPVSSSMFKPRSRPAVQPVRTTRQRPPTKAVTPITRQGSVPGGAGTKRPASSPPSNRSFCQPRSRKPIQVRVGPTPRTVQNQPCPAVTDRNRQKICPEVAASTPALRPARIPSPTAPITRSNRRIVAAMDFSEEEHTPVKDRTRPARHGQTVDSMDTVITGSPGSGLVLRVGRQGREPGQFINPQGICYNAADGGLLLVADNNCACVQVSSIIITTPRSYDSLFAV